MALLLILAMNTPVWRHTGKKLFQFGTCEVTEEAAIPNCPVAPPRTYVQKCSNSSGECYWFETHCPFGNNDWADSNDRVYCAEHPTTEQG